MKYIIAIAVLIFSVDIIWAQYRISGIILNSDRTGIEYASIRVLSEDSVFIKAATANAVGKYTFELPENGGYLFQYSALGYNVILKRVEISKKETIIPDIILKTGSNSLSEVTVSGNRITRVDNHLLIIPDKASVKHSFSAYQLLDNLMLPGLDVIPQSGIVKLLGCDVSLYIDGQPADYSLVKNLRSRDIAKIEYHDVPTGRYSQDYAAINFITKKYKFGGYVNLDVQQNIGHLNGTYEGYVQIATGNTKRHISGGYEMWDMSRGSNYSSETYNFTDNPVTRENRSAGGNSKRDSEYGQFRIENSDNKRQLSLQAAITHRRNDKDMNSILSYSTPYEITENAYTWEKNNYTSPSVTGYGYFSLPKKQWLSVRIRASYTHRLKNSLYSADEGVITNRAKEDYFTTSGSVTYGKTFKHNNSITASLDESFTTSSINYDGSFDSWQHLWSSDLKGYLSYRHRIKKVSLNALLGLTVTQMRIHGKKLSTGKIPDIYFESIYRPTKLQQLRASIYITTGYTQLAYLTDGEVQTDFLNIRKGNPLLKRDTYYYNANLTYSIMFGRFNALSNITLGKKDDAVFNSYYLTSDKLVQTYSNGDFNYLTTIISISWNANKSLRLNLSGVYNHREIKSFKSRYHNSINSELKATYFWRDFNFNVSLLTPYETMNDWATTKSSFKYDLNIGWNHKNWSISAWTTNPIERRKTTTKMNIPEVRKYYWSNQTRNGFIKIIYTFDFGKKVQHTGVDRVNTSAGSAIL